MKKSYIYAVFTVLIWATNAALVKWIVLLGEKIEIRAFLALVFIIGGIFVQSLFENRVK